MSKNQPARQSNIDALVKYFESGIKTEGNALGIELEHTLVHKNGDPVSYTEEFGQKWLLKELERYFPEEMIDDDGDLIGLARNGSTVTLEPAAQLEFSAGPFTDLQKAEDSFKRFESEVVDLISPHDVFLLSPGYHPTRRAIDLELIPKVRYDYMNKYLGSISMFGICMMRGSAATQVAIDFTSTEDCLRKLKLASACVPVFSLICDNSPIFEGEVRKHEMVRTEIWEKCDPDRCGIVDGVMSPDFTLEDYAENILDTPAIIDVSSGSQVFSEKTFGEIYADKTMEKADIEHALSMFFNDIRLKTYIEIRPADAMPIEYVVAYAALIKGLFYDETSLSHMESIFEEVSEKDIAEAKSSLMENGYDGKAYGHPVSEIADELISLASASLNDKDLELLRPLAQLVADRTTLAAMALE